MVDSIFGIKKPIVFLMVFFVTVIPSGWFMYSSYTAFTNILSTLQVGQSKTSAQLFDTYRHDRDIAISPFMVRAQLEYDTLSNRQSRTNSFIETRTWLRFMSSGIGAITIFIGSIFLLARVESAQAEVTATGSNWGASVATSSPGVILVLVGAGLMVVPNIADQPIDTHDGASFLGLAILQKANDQFVKPSKNPAYAKQLDALRQEQVKLESEKSTPKHAEK